MENIRPYFINGHVLKVQFGAESQVVSAAPLSSGTPNNKTSASFKPKKAHKRARPCGFHIEDLGRCSAWCPVCAHAEFQSHFYCSPSHQVRNEVPQMLYWYSWSAARQENSGSEKPVPCIYMEWEIRKTNVTPVHEFSSYHFPSLLCGEWFDSHWRLFGSVLLGERK